MENSKMKSELIRPQLYPTGRRIGEANNPGPSADGNFTPFVILSRNIRGLYANMASAIRSNADIICLQEADMDERHVPEIKALAHSAGYQIFFGAPTALSLDGKSNSGRRIAILVKGKAKAEIITDKADKHINLLALSGRWLEVCVPVGAQHHLLLIEMYRLQTCN